MALVLILLGVAGCTVFPDPTRILLPLPLHRPETSPLITQGYVDVAGVIHIHTRYSHDAHGRFEEAIRVANAMRLDYLVFTEHNTLQPLRDGRQGWHGTVLALIGVEISTPSGHYLALNVTEEIDRHKFTAQQVIDEVNRQGGLGFIAHPYFKNGRWRDWTVTGFTGIEAYNVAHDTLDENKLRLALWTLTAPAGPFYYSILDRPYDPLSAWDAMIHQHGKAVGIGSADAHEFHALGITFAPYEMMFQMARTHLLVPAGPLTPEAIYDALRRGHAYLSIELTAEARGFACVASLGERVLGVMGDEVALADGLRLRVTLPAAAQMALLKDGQPIAWMTGLSWDVPVIEPGAYRLEVTRHGKPWIISNPIYVRPRPPAGGSP